MHTYFWSLRDIQKQRIFLIKQSKKKERSHHIKGKEEKNFLYLFPVNAVDSEESENMHVCKIFFLHTLNLSDRYIYTAWEKLDVYTVIKDDDQGKHKNNACVSKESMDSIQQHIKSFPLIELHYLRQQNRKMYVEGNLTLAEMY